MSALTDVFTAIANAIRGKNGTQNTYTPSQMAQAITDIPSGGGKIYILDASPLAGMYSVDTYINSSGALLLTNMNYQGSNFVAKIPYFLTEETYQAIQGLVARKNSTERLNVNFMSIYYSQIIASSKPTVYPAHRVNSVYESIIQSVPLTLRYLTDAYAGTEGFAIGTYNMVIQLSYLREFTI